MVQSEVLRIWLSGGVGALPGLLADDATFSSPVTDYTGRQDVAHMLGLIAQVVEDVRPGQEWRDGSETASAFTARFQGEEMQGMLREQHDSSNALVHVTLYLRPYRMLRPAIARMGELLALSPLPGAGHRQAETGG
jgi:hypothetical protein